MIMPDVLFKAAQGHVAALEPVTYEPYVTYRGRVLWHNQSDAMDVAHAIAKRRKTRHAVKAVRIPGWSHPLWIVKCPPTPKAKP